MSSHIMTKSYVSQLLGYGLNEAGIRVYVFLLQHGEFRISDIANMNQLPRTTVYEALKQLRKFGLIEEITFENYKKIHALPFTSIRHHIDEKTAQLKDLKLEAREIERTLQGLPNLRSQTPTKVRYYDGVSGARQIFWNSLKAKDTVYVYSSWGRSPYMGKAFYEKFVAESRNRHITERVLVENNHRIHERISEDLGKTDFSRSKLQNIRASNKLDIAGEVLIYNNIYAQVTLKQDFITGFEIENQKFVDMQRSIIEALWKKARLFK